MQTSKSIEYENKIIIGDCLQIIKDFADDSIDLINDAKNSTEIKSFHLEKWNEILEAYKIENK